MKYNIHGYDHYLVQFSGGKDSTAVFLYLLEQGIPREKIELWHQNIDAGEKGFMDWEITPEYCRRFAESFGVKIYFQWKIGGFRREMLRHNSLTAPTRFEQPDGTIGQAGGTLNKPNTRMKFSQLSADLNVRWCSGYLKVDVCKTSIVNQERFRGKQVLVISGERGEESPQRAKYAIFERDKSDKRDNLKLCRHVDRFRPLRDWKEQQVWEIIERYRVHVHPCYYMGWARCSCKFCIFSSPNQMASAALVSPALIEELIIFEKKFGYTMKRNTDLRTFIATGKPYSSITPELIRLGTGHIYDLPIIIPGTEPWALPVGAYGESVGPN